MLSWRFPASQKILRIVWRWVYVYIFISERKRSKVHSWICLNEKNSSVSSVWWTLLPGRRGARIKSKVRNLPSSLITILFSPQVYIILQTVPVSNAYAQKNSSIRQAKNRPKEPNSYSTMRISPKLRPQKYTAIFSVRSLKWAQCSDFVIDLTSQFLNRWCCLDLL